MKTLFISLFLFVLIFPCYGQSSLGWNPTRIETIESTTDGIETTTDNIETATTAIQVDVDTLLNGGLINISTSALLPPQGTTDTLFYGYGSMNINEIVGKVTIAIGAAPNATKIQLIQGAVTTDLCATLDIDGDLVNTSYTITGTFANDMVNNAADTPLTGRQANPVRIIDEVASVWYIVLNCAGSSGTGKIQWSISAERIGKGSNIVAN